MLKEAVDRKKRRELEAKEREGRIITEKLKPLKKQCTELGFKPGTKKFKNCVLELI